MSRKHLNAIANALSVHRPSEDAGADAWTQWRSDCFAMANVCQELCERFDRERFLDACGIYSCGIC